MITHTYFTKAQEQWLVDNFHRCESYSHLTELFNSMFHTDRNVGMISDKCSKRLKLTGMHNSSKYGNKKKEQLPIGTVRTSQTGTYVKVKEIESSACISGYAKPYWIPLQQKIYEDAYGSIPENAMICFLDCDRTNFDLNNLYPISRSISARMSKNGWWSKNSEITLTGIKWCELQLKIKQLTLNR